MTREEMLKDVESVIGTTKWGPSIQSDGDAFEAITRFASCIQRNAPKNSTHARMIEDMLAKHASEIVLPPGKLGEFVREARGILLGLRDEIEAGRHWSFEELVHADLFDDFLEQSEFLNSKNFIRAATVVAGVTLEEHLRKLAEKNEVETKKSNGGWKKAAAINDALVKAEIYPSPQRTQILAWLELRNDAAHPEDDFEKEHDNKEIEQVIMGIRDFMIRYPA